MTRAGVLRLSRFAVAAVLAASFAPLPSAAQSTAPQILIAATPNDSGGTPFYALDLGNFKKAGLDVKVQPVENPGNMVAAVIGGSATFGTLTIPGIALAREKGVPIVIVAPTSIYNSATPTSGIIVLKSSPIKKASDLNGKTVATRDISNLSYFGANNWIDKNGGDSKSVKWVEINDTQTVPAMIAGRVDAASVSEPAFDDAIHGPNARMLAPIYDAIGDKFLIGAIFTTEEYAKAHPDIVRKFSQVIIDTAIWANRNRPLSAKILEKYAGVPVPPGTTRVAYAERIRPADAQPVLDMLKQYGALKSSLRASDLFAVQIATTP
ncbi:MAG TPA: ABC transporter substrate-binding protein [Candidatus Binatia bacterium]|nr:ABC transporter substrate-binding protein [Candidatus Binatia bacterium]